MTVYTCIPAVPPQFFDNNGDPLSSGLLFCYFSGTTTKQDSFNGADSTTASVNANPIVLDSSGRASIFLPPDTSYKFVLAPSTDTDPPTSPIWTRDGVTSYAPYGTSTDVSATAGENLTVRDLVYLSDGTGSLTAGRWYKADADLGYQGTTPEKLGIAMATATTGNSLLVRILGRVTGYAGLTAGTTLFVSTTGGALATSGYRKAAVADSTTSIVLIGDGPPPFNVDILGTASQNLVAGNWVYSSASIGWTKARADLPTSTMPALIGYIPQDIASGQVGVIRIHGSVPAAVTAGTIWYIDSSTAGAITSTAPAKYIRRVAVADSTGDYVIVQDGGYGMIPNYTAVGNIGGGEDILMSDIIPANTFVFDGRAVRVQAFGFFSADVENRTVNVRVGGTAAPNDGTTVLSTGITGGLNGLGWQMQMIIMRNTSGNLKANATLLIAGIAIFNGNVFTLAETVTNDVFVKMTGTATTTNSIVQSVMLIETVK